MRLFECFDSVYVINLDSRPDRMMGFRESMRSLGLLDHEIDEKIIRFPGVIPPSGAGPLGCTLSHLEIVRDAKRRGYEKILIFEDDAQPFVDGLPYFDDVIDDIVSQEWDVYYLGYNSHNNLSLHSKNSLVARDLFSTHAIAYRSSFFDRFIDDQRHDRIKVFDVWISEQVQTSMKCLASYPMLFIQQESYSDIEKKNVNYGIQIERYQNYTSHLPRPFKKD